MTPINKVIINKSTEINPIWIMRQAGRYLPEFRKIRSKNTDFIKLCLNENLSAEITLQPLKRFNLDAAIIFSDILLLPYGLGQKVEFQKNFGPKLGEIDLNKISKTDEIDFLEKVHCVYKAIKKVSLNPILNNKNTISNEKWPQVDLNFIKKNNVKIPIQINGKVRAVIEVPIDTNKEDIEKIALKEKNVLKFLNNNPKKVIIIPNRIVNFVV